MWPKKVKQTNQISHEFHERSFVPKTVKCMNCRVVKWVNQSSLVGFAHVVRQEWVSQLIKNIILCTREGKKNVEKDVKMEKEDVAK